MGKLDLADVQGNILRGYRMAMVRHLVVRVRDAAAARQFLGRVVPGAASDAPQVTTAEHWDEKPATCLNVGITFAGLRALGLSDSSCKTFPHEFRDGPVKRAAKIGDVEESAPEHWQAGLDQPDGVHMMWTIHAGAPGDPGAAALLDEASNRVLSLWSASGAFTEVGRFDGTAFADDRVHFGYRDSISQPTFRVSRQLPGKPGEAPVYAAEPEIIGGYDSQPVAELGAVLLGHKTTFPDVTWQMPQPNALGYNGCFNAFRVLKQDVDGFEKFLSTSVAAHGKDRPFVTEEWIAAKLMGRWRNGLSLEVSDMSDVSPWRYAPDGTDMGNDFKLNDFDYTNDVIDAVDTFDDFEGVRCPLGAHVRRTNPRGARIVQRSANNTRRIVRRGMPYGPPYDPEHPNDGTPRGLLGNFLCGSLIAQFESIMYDWVNMGLQDPRITGTNDPLIGANHVRSSRFEIPLKDSDPIVLTGFGRFVTTVGSAYLFIPSTTALKHLSTLGS